jgi:hypothetical protein
MSVYVYVPAPNPIGFVEKDRSFTDEHGSKPYGLASYLDSLSSQDVSEPYYQPFYKNGTLYLQIHVAATSSIKANFYSADTGEKIHTVTISNPPLTLTTNIVPGTTDEQLYIQLIGLQPSTYSQLDDYDLVWLELELDFSGTVQYLLSKAPIHLFTENEEFTKITYTCNTNKFDVFWANKNPLYYPVFTLWVEASKMLRESSYEHLTYDEMNGTTEELYSNVRDMYTFRVGGNVGVPDFMIDIVDRALACDNKLIDGRVYILKEVGEASGKSYRQTKEYTLSEPDDTVKNTFRQSELTLWERPASSYPYAVGNLTLQDDAGRTIRLDARILTGSGDESSLITTMNSRATSAGSSGTFSESSGTFLFTNGDGEMFSVVTDVQVLHKQVEIDINVGTSSTTYSHISAFPDPSSTYYHIINWGISTGITYDELWTSGNVNPGAINASNTYASTGNYTIKLFHKNEDTIFNATATGTQPKITDVTGDLSSVLERIYFQGQDFSGLAALDLSFIAPAKDSLNTIVIKSSGLDAITAGWASGLVVGTPPNWYRPFFKIAFIDLSGNTLSSTEVDAFCNELHGSTRWQAGYKTLNVKFQTPTAPPTGSSLTARNAFTANFWAVFTD